MKNSMIGMLLLSVAISGCSSNSSNNESNVEQLPTETSPTASATPMVTAVPTPTLEQSPETANTLDLNKLSNTFGFADNDAKRIITVEGQQDQAGESGDSVKEFNKAIGDNGHVLKVRYLKHQARTEDDNGRQAAYNFSNLEGDLFEILDGSAIPNESYYLVNESQFNVESLVKLNKVAPRTTSSTIQEEIMKARDRAIGHSWQLASTDKGQQIFLVQFERQEDQMLASLVLYDDGKWVFMDYPATYNESSTWRVDDQGEISPDMFSFLFAAQSSEGMVLGVKWMGAEGENISLLKQSGDRFVEIGITSGRYLSPI